ncbi:hypothetical protein NDU88_007475 [Pleurodeles waltl]|uniref:Uncharacterized protein n=1 Tax=Pleurodeles waltl TaxID=8319 RepID=A0AAV7QS15_PLEWA|nr:hypothetical protein NDU88_007475 [Pleurodeles waltl]
MDNSSKVIQALTFLQEEAREDLLQEGVLEQAWVGSKRPKRTSSEGMVAVVISCASPARKSKKFGQKSVVSRKNTASTDSVVLVKDKEGGGLPGQIFGSRRGGTKFVRRSGASIRQRVVSRDRGVSKQSAVAGDGCLGDCAVHAHAPRATRIVLQEKKQALLPSDITSE